MQVHECAAQRRFDCHQAALATAIKRTVFGVLRLWWTLQFDLGQLFTVVSKLSHRKILRFVTNEMTRTVASQQKIALVLFF